MSISSVTNRVGYQGDGTSAVFAFPYRFKATTDLAVFVYNSSATSPGIISAKVLSTDYTVSATADASGVFPNGGNVVFNSTPNSQAAIVIFRSSVVTNDFSVGQNGIIPATGLNNELDYLTLITQRLQDQTTRAVRLHDGLSGTFDPTLPANILSSGGKRLAVNSSANGWTFETVDVNSYIANTLIYATTNSSIASLPGAASGLFLQSNGSSAPTWNTVSINSGTITGILGVDHGGTGTSSSFPEGRVIFAGGSSYTTSSNFIFRAGSSYLGLGGDPLARLDIPAQTNTQTMASNSSGLVIRAARQSFVDAVSSNAVFAEVNAYSFHGTVQDTTNGSTTITNFNAVSVLGPIAGGGLNVTNLSTLRVPTFAVNSGAATVITAYGLNVAAPTGATNNYAANFSGGNVGIGISQPQALLDVRGLNVDAKIRLVATQNGPSAVNSSNPGIELSATGMNLNNKYTPAFKFMSRDPDFTTETPKFLAAVIGRATEPYTADTHGGMAVDILTSPNNVGSTSAPLTRLSIDSSGRMGLGNTAIGSSVLFHMSSTIGGFLAPVMTTAERGAINSGFLPATGLHIFNGTLNLPNWWTGSTWITPVFDQTLNTTGDIFVFNGTSAAAVRQSVGSDGTFLKADSTAANGVSWASVSGAALSVATKTAAYNATTADDILIANSTNYTINLYGTSGNSGKALVIKRGTTSNSSAVTVAGSSATIDGVSTIQLVNTGDFVKLFCDGTNWQVESDRITCYTHWSHGSSTGSTDTKIRKFLADIDSNGNAFTAAQSLANGLTITINLPGKYSFSYTDVFGDASGEDLGLSLNSNQLTTDVTSVASSAILAMGNTGVANQPQTVSWTGSLKNGDVVRPHVRANASSTVDGRAHFWASRI